MNRCKTCAHWDRKYHIEPDQRLCLAKKLDSTEPDGARIAYVERRHAMFLATSPEFGCVHHTPAAGVRVGCSHCYDGGCGDPLGCGETDRRNAGVALPRRGQP
jgi:hypothetical protein